MGKRDGRRKGAQAHAETLHDDGDANSGRDRQRR
jgi:hypothetical protein